MPPDLLARLGPLGLADVFPQMSIPDTLWSKSNWNYSLKCFMYNIPSKLETKFIPILCRHHSSIKKWTPVTYSTCIQPELESKVNKLMEIFHLSTVLPLAASVRASVISMCLTMVLYFAFNADSNLFSLPSSSKVLISSSRWALQLKYKVSSLPSLIRKEEFTKINCLVNSEKLNTLLHEIFATR